MEIKVKKITIIQFVMIYLMFVSSRAVIYALNKDIIVYCMLGLCTLFSIMYRRTVNTKLYLIFLILGASLYLTRLLAGSGWGLNAYMIIVSTIWCTYVAYTLDKKSFLQRYINLCAFFSIISLIGWFFLLFAPNILDRILIKDYSLFHGSKGVLFYVYRYAQLNNVGDRRNVGIFTEPGIYQIVLNSALYCLLFHRNRFTYAPKKYGRLILLFIFTIISTQSTTGYLALVLIMSVYLFTIKNDRIKQRIIGIILLGAILLVVDYLANSTESFLYLTIIGKFFNQTTNSFDINASTGYWRMNAIVAGWKMFLDNPLGAGDAYYDNFLLYSQGVSGSGAGLIQTLGICGILTTGIITYCVLSPAWKNRKCVIMFILYVFLWINTALAQAEIVYGCILMLGLIENDEVIVREKDNS